MMLQLSQMLDELLQFLCSDIATNSVVDVENILSEVDTKYEAMSESTNVQSFSRSRLLSEFKVRNPRQQSQAATVGIS